jgi:PGF-CTERM protein
MHTITRRLGVAFVCLLCLTSTVTGVAVGDTGATHDEEMSDSSIHTTAEDDSHTATVGTRNGSTAGDPTSVSTPGNDTRRTADARPRLTTTLNVRQHPESGVVTIVVRLDIPENIVNTTVTLPPGLNVTAADGLNRTQNRTWTWREGETDRDHTPTLTTTYEVNRTNTHFDGFDSVGTGEWALFAVPDVRLHWRWDSGRGPTYREPVRLGANATGYAGVEWVFVGDATVDRRQIDYQNVTLVVPDSAPDGSLSPVVRQLREAIPLLNVQQPNDRIDVFLAPSPIRRGGLESTEFGGEPDALWVSTRTVDENSLITSHEYVHTRQSFNTSARMDWLDEGHAEYTELLLGLETGRIDYAEFRSKLAGTEESSVNLTDPTHDLSADYEKGARVVAVIDTKIRRATDGERTFEDVWIRLNAHDGTVTYRDFKQILERVAGQSFDDWLDTATSGSGWVDVPSDRSLFGMDARPIDTDGDGLSAREESRFHTDAVDADTDNDSLSDGFEVTVGTDPTLNDTDGDGIDDDVELNRTTNATLADTDGDGLDDGREVELGTNATVTDTDGDGIDDGREVELGTDPTVADTDDDGLDDGREVELGTDPTVADTDDDGLDDGREVELGTDPTVADTDDDGLDDGREVELGTDPTVADTDGDGIDDGDEVAEGTDPTDGDDPPAETATSTDTRTDTATADDDPTGTTATTSETTSATTTGTTSTGTPGFGWTVAVIALLVGLFVGVRRN